MAARMEIRETLDFGGFDFEQRLLLQVFAIKNASTAQRGGLLLPALAILSQKQGMDNDDSMIIAYKLNENNSGGR